jgi:hypothetical protein
VGGVDEVFLRVETRLEISFRMFTGEVRVLVGC